MARRASLALVTLASLALTGCRSGRQEATYHIAVVPKGVSHSFWQYIRAGAIQAARDRGDTEIHWDGPAKEDMRDLQQQIVERFASQGISALVLAPTDRQTLVQPVETVL